MLMFLHLRTENANLNHILNRRTAFSLRLVTYGRINLDKLSGELFTAYCRFEK